VKRDGTSHGDLPLALSLREAARALRVDRGTLSLLVKRGTLRVVPWGRRVRVPLVEAQRLAAVGWTLDEAKARRAPRRRPGVVDPEQLRALRVEDL
jgi:excisionase family DNA binding protein